MKQSLNNNELKIEYRKNPRKGLESIYEAYADQMVQYAVHSMRLTPEQAEDAVHQAFIPWVKEHEKMIQVENIRAYLYTTLRYACFRFRNQKADFSIDPEQEAIPGKDAELSEDIDSALQKLNQDQREVVFLKIWSELSFEEIAELQKVPLQTAASRYRYAMAKLKEILKWNQ